MMGAFAARAAAIAALAELEPMTFTAGRAKPASFPYAKSSFTALPVRTPGLRFSLFNGHLDRRSMRKVSAATAQSTTTTWPQRAQRWSVGTTHEPDSADAMTRL